MLARLGIAPAPQALLQAVGVDGPRRGKFSCKTGLQTFRQAFSQPGNTLLESRRGNGIAPHNISVFAVVAVIPLAHARVLEAIFSIEGLRSSVGHSHLKGHAESAHLLCYVYEAQ